MNSSELRRFVTDLQENPELQAEFKERVKDFDGLFAWATGKGYQVAAQELRDLALVHDELSDEDLDQAAGGTWIVYPPPGGDS